MLSLEQVVVLKNCNGSTKSAIAYYAAQAHNNCFFDEAVARKMVDHLKTAGFVRQEEGVYWVTRAGQKALEDTLASIDNLLKVKGK